MNVCFSKAECSEECSGLYDGKEPIHSINAFERHYHVKKHDRLGANGHEQTLLNNTMQGVDANEELDCLRDYRVLNKEKQH